MKTHYRTGNEWLDDFTREQQHLDTTPPLETKALPVRPKKGVTATPSALQQLALFMSRLDRRLVALEQRITQLEPPPTTKGVALHYQTARIERTS